MADDEKLQQQKNMQHTISILPA